MKHIYVVLYRSVSRSHVRFIDYNEICNVICIHTCEMLCLSFNMDVHTWKHDLAEVRNTHVLDIIHNLQAHAHVRLIINMLLASLATR